MSISSRTPDGEANRCPICGNAVCIEPSKDTRDAPCPHCGHLLWFEQPFVHFKVESADGSTVVRFVDKELRDELTVQAIGEDLIRLVAVLGRQNLRLDFSNVATLSSSVLGKLITLNRKLQPFRGKLVLCGLSKEIREIFHITKLDQLLTIEID
jgi:anti-sigma B factor antagonist